MTKNLVKNKKAFHDYQIIESYEAGVSLVGTEVKSCRLHNINFSDSYVKITGAEALLHNVHIGPYEKSGDVNHEPKRVRKLLLHKSEIRKLTQATRQQSCTLVPLSFYLKNGWIKVSVGICRGKSKADKRETLKKSQADMDMRKALKRR